MNNSKKYKVVVIQNNIIYAKKLKKDYLLGDQYIIFQKNYLKEKNIQKLALVI